MPSKIQLDENLWFLYVCLQNSDLKAIDFNAVGEETNLKPPAARMRYTRLRRQIEDGTLIGTHGTPFAGSTEKVGETLKKRKRCRDMSRQKNGVEEDIPKAKLARVINSMAKDHEPDGRRTDSLCSEDSKDELPLAKVKGLKSSEGLLEVAVGIHSSVAVVDDTSAPAIVRMDRRSLTMYSHPEVFRSSSTKESTSLDTSSATEGWN